MKGIGREGLVLLLLRAQLVLCLAMLVSAPFLGGALLFFSELPGGMMDAASSGPGDESAIYAGLFHVLYTAALAFFVFGISWDVSPRATLLVHVLGAILTFPFGLFLARESWRTTQADGWDAAHHEAGRIGRRRAITLGATWAGVQVMASIATLIAYVAVLSGNLLVGVVALISNGVIQWGGFLGIQRWQKQTKLQTFGSPMPELPSQPSSR